MKQLIVVALLIATVSTAFAQACVNCDCGKSRISLVS